MFIIVIIASIIGYRYIKYRDFLGRFSTEAGSYYEFNLFSWKESYDGKDEVDCSLWNCNIVIGPIYYQKKDSLYMRMDSKGISIQKFKLEKKDNKTYLYFYDSNNNLAETYIKM